MARKMTECPSKRRPLINIVPSDGCKGGAVSLAVDQCYDFHESGYHMGNVGSGRPRTRLGNNNSGPGSMESPGEY